MHDSSHTVSLPILLAQLRRHRLVIGLTVLLAIGASVALSATSQETYTAKAVIGFNDESDDLQALGTAASPNFQPDKLAAAQAERITRPDIIERVRELARTDLTPVEVQDSVETQVEAASNLVSLTVEARTGQLAADLANAFARAIREDQKERSVKRYRAAARAARKRAEQFDGQENIVRRATYEEQASRFLALASFTRPVDIVRTADVPSTPSSPKPVRNAILAALIGLIMGVGIAFLRETLDRRLREPADVEQALGLPVVGALPSAALGGTPLLTPKGKVPDEQEVEPFKILRTNVGFLSLDGDVGVVLVTSALPQEGKSSVAAGLAWAEAKTGKRTLLVDCDLRRPTIGDRFGLASTPGLSDYLLGDARPADIVRAVGTGAENETFACIPAGRVIGNHAELLASARFKEFLAQVGEAYDRVIVDSAPLLPVSDTLSLLPQVGGVLMCVRLGQTTRDESRAAKAALDRFPARPTGLVVTAADTSRQAYYVGTYAYQGVTQGAV